MKRKQRSDSDRLWEYALMAREAWAIKPGQTSVRGSLRVPAHLAALFESQSSEDRGATWSDGYLVQEQIPLLYHVLHFLSGGQNVDYACGDRPIVIVGSSRFEASTQVEALMRAIAHYLPPVRATGQPE